MRLQRRLYGIAVYSIFLHSGFLVGQKWLISVLNHLLNHKNSQLNAKTKIQASNRHIFRVLGRLHSLILCG